MYPVLYSDDLTLKLVISRVTITTGDYIIHPMALHDIAALFEDDLIQGLVI
jgi:hypothetical protein